MLGTCCECGAFMSRYPMSEEEWHAPCSCGSTIFDIVYFGVDEHHNFAGVRKQKRDIATGTALGPVRKVITETLAIGEEETKEW